MVRVLETYGYVMHFLNDGKEKQQQKSSAFRHWIIYHIYIYKTRKNKMN